MSIPRRNRLRKSSDFVVVSREGRRFADSHIVLIARPNGGAESRFGFTVSRRLGNAVNRNRIRRRLQAAAVGSGVPGGWDIVLIARQRAREADFRSLDRSLTRLLTRANLIKRNT